MHVCKPNLLLISLRLTLFWALFVGPLAQPRPAVLAAPAAQVQGPRLSDEITPAEFTGSLLDLPQQPQALQLAQPPQPLKYTPGTRPKGSAPSLDQWIDPILQDTPPGQTMPGLIRSFDGISMASGGSGWPPDPVGDVGEAHYIQAVNTSIAIFDKAGGNAITAFSFNDFFSGTNTPCDYNNHGDPVVVYDRLTQRWLITDFSIGGPYYECIALSKTSDPISGGWYFYAVKISTNAINDYPKVGVWNDSYVITFNMFGQPGDVWGGAQVWAFEKSRMVSGQKVQAVSFAISAESGYGGLLPSHALSAPAAGSPSYVATVSAPNQLLIWKLQPNWSNPASSTFSSTPYIVPVANFALADSVPQPGVSDLLDSLSPRPMMQLIFRRANGAESLWLNHTVTNRGVGAIRWYEVDQLGGSPTLVQQGTYQPDPNHRWMGSLAVDRDGNMALGYSISSETIYPGIRYTGRMAGEIPGQLPQGENVLIPGSGSQTGVSASNRWGDYSAMSVDPGDDCTFWYTTEYYAISGANWRTRVGSFKYPSCGQAKGHIQGVVRNAVTNQPVANALVSATSNSQQMTVLTNEFGVYAISLAPDMFSLKAGPLAPGYPTQVSLENVPLAAGNVTLRDLLLNPAPNLVEGSQSVVEPLSGWFNNGYAEPGEQNLQLFNGLLNNGAITATLVSAKLESLTSGVVVTEALSAYPDILAGQAANNLTPFRFSLASSLTCGQEIRFRKTITESLKTTTQTFSLRAGIPATRAAIYSNTFEGPVDWTPGGISPTWAITTTLAHSPSHAWTDSPSGSYADNSNQWITSPLINLSGREGVQARFWARYALEPGYDYVYLEYSTDGGASWKTQGDGLALLNGVQNSWQEIVVAAPQLDQQSQVRLRFRLVSDGGVNMDGVYLDDVRLTYQPYVCLYGLGQQPHLWLPLVKK